MVLRVALLLLGLGQACAGSSSENSSPAPEPEAGTLSSDGSEADACGGRGESLDALEVSGDSGSILRVVASEPDRMVVGDHAWTVELTRDGEPRLGLAERMQVTPFMPDHGHGTAVVVQIDALEDGRYRLAPVNLRMPGYWRITIEIADAGDEAAETLQFGVCVQ